MPRLAWPLLVALAACSSRPPDPSDPGAPSTPVEPREPVPFLPETEVDGAAPELSPEEVGAVIEQRFAALITAVPTGFPAAFDALMAFAEPGCPAIVDASEGSRTQLVVRAEECTTTAGATFSGSIDYDLEAGTVDGDGNNVDGMEFFAQSLRIEAPDGRFLEADGYFSFRHLDNPDSRWASSYCTGTLRADDATAGDDVWLQGSVEGLVAVFVGDFGGYRLATVDATVATDDPAVSGVALQELRWEPGQCPNELIGAGSVREVNGVWHDVVFATRLESEEVIQCDGCGVHQTGGSRNEAPVCNTDAFDDLVDFTGGLPW